MGTVNMEGMVIPTPNLKVLLPSPHRRPVMEAPLLLLRLSSRQFTYDDYLYFVYLRLWKLSKRVDMIFGHSIMTWSVHTFGMNTVHFLVFFVRRPFPLLRISLQFATSDTWIVI